MIIIEINEISENGMCLFLMNALLNYYADSKLKTGFACVSEVEQVNFTLLNVEK